MTDRSSETSSTFRDVAEKGVEQARDAVGTLLEAARKASEAIQSTTSTADQPAGVAVSRGFGFAKENISAIFDLTQQLVRAPDLKEAIRLQSDFVKTQADTMRKQVEELKSLGPKTGE